MREESGAAALAGADAGAAERTTGAEVAGLEAESFSIFSTMTS
jgi:hypothetical protein